MKIKLAGLERNSVVDGPGLRTVIFAQGCPHNCPGCHNPLALDPRGGYWREVEEMAGELCGEPGIQGITFSGGEPFLQAESFAMLAALLKKKGLNIVTYTGYTFEELRKQARLDLHTAALLDASDILIDGPYQQEKRDISLAFRGSANQRIIDLAKTRAAGKIVLSPLYYS